jgi:hypothetical protein
MRKRIDSFVINREDRPERKEHAINTLLFQGFEPEIFNAIITQPGWKGCRDSHLEILEKNKHRAGVFIFEDDIEFSIYYDNQCFYDMCQELPLDFDCLSLGLSPQEPFERYSEHLFKIGKAWCLHATMWNNREGGAVEYILTHKEEIGKIDVFLSEKVYPNFNCFVGYPILCTQKQFPSDTCGKSDVSTIVKNYNKYCK